jgi:hypothetical protein
MPRQRTLASAAAGGRLLLVVAAVLLCLSVPPGRAAPPGAEVAEFPGFTGKLPSKHYAGYDLSSSIYGKKFEYFVPGSVPSVALHTHNLVSIADISSAQVRNSWST